MRFAGGAPPPGGAELRAGRCLSSGCAGEGSARETVAAESAAGGSSEGVRSMWLGVAAGLDGGALARGGKRILGARTALLL